MVADHDEQCGLPLELLDQTLDLVVNIGQLCIIRAVAQFCGVGLRSLEWVVRIVQVGPYEQRGVEARLLYPPEGIVDDLARRTLATPGILCVRNCIEEGIEEEDDDKETKDLVRLVQNIKRKFGSPTKRAPGPSERHHETPTERASAVIARDLSSLAINLENYKHALIILIKCVNEESASWESAEQELIARRALRRQMQYSYPTNPRKDELKRELVEIRKKRLENLRLQSRNEFDSERYMAELLTEEKEKEWKNNKYCFNRRQKIQRIGFSWLFYG